MNGVLFRLILLLAVIILASAAAGQVIAALTPVIPALLVLAVVWFVAIGIGRKNQKF